MHEFCCRRIRRQWQKHAATPLPHHIGKPISATSVVGTAAMFCLFYAVMHPAAGNGVTLPHLSIFLAVFHFYPERADRVYTQAVLLFGFFGVVLLLPNPSFQLSGQEIAALAGLDRAEPCQAWAYLQVRELSLLGEPGWRVMFIFDNRRRYGIGLGSTLTGCHQHSPAALPYLFLRRACRHSLPNFP